MVFTFSYQVDEYCSKKEKLEIVGVYHANELINENEPSVVAMRIADKVSSVTPPGCILTVFFPEITTIAKYNR